MRYFCTYFDSNYLTRGITLYRSMELTSREPFMIWVLCVDDLSYRVMSRLNLPHTKLISMKEFETTYPDLPPLKAERNALEYLWTCKPSLALYALDHDPDADLITYLDADFFFFGDLQPMFDEIGSNAVMICPHRFPAHMTRRAKRGIYNAGLLSFRRDEDGLAALRWWREKCIEWCFDRVEETRLAEQKYLNYFPARFNRVVELQHKGINVACWNWMNYTFRKSGDVIMVDDQPLIFYHYASLRAVNSWLYETGLLSWDPMPGYLLEWIYDPYLSAIKKNWLEARVIDGEARLMGRVDYRFSPRRFLQSLRAGQIRRVR